MYMNRFRDMFRKIPIKQKLILLMMVVALVSVALTTLASTLAGVIYIKKNEEKELAVLAELIGDKNAAALAFHDQKLVKANLEVLTSKPSVLRACIYDMDSNIFATYAPTGTQHHCPDVIGKHHTMDSGYGMIDIFNAVTKKDRHLGVVYLQSDMRAVNYYLQQQWLAASGIMGIICLVSYLISLWLQRVISNPISILVKEVKAIFEDDYSVRTRGIYYDELGDIAESFNKILEERERKHKEFFTKAEALGQLSQSTEKTLAILDDESIFPFKAASTFKTLLTQQVFGPVDVMYSEYFHDVYTAEVQLYYVLAKAFDSLRLQSEMISSEKEMLIVDDMVCSIVTEAFDKAADPRLCYTICAGGGHSYYGYKKPLQRFIENIVTLFIENKALGKLYNCAFEVKKCEKGISLLTMMNERGNQAAPSNDNYLCLSLDSLIDKIKNNEELPVIKGEYLFNVKDVVVCSRLYAIHFLSHINQAKVEVSLSSGGVILEVHLDNIRVPEIEEQKPDTITEAEII